MKKTTITFTALPCGVTNSAGTGAKLRLSVFIAPRLWTTEPTEQTQILHLADYPIFADWPSQVSAMQFGVTFAGGPTLSATAVSAPELRSDLWNALFPATLPVKPFRFDNLANTPIQTIDTAYLEDWLHELYRRVGTDPAYGAGVGKPPIGIMQRDPGLAAIARPSQPEPPYEPPVKRRVPIYYKPNEPENENGGCLKWLIDILNSIASVLGLGKPFKLPGGTLLSSSIHLQNTAPELTGPAQAAHPTPPLPLATGNVPIANTAAQGMSAKEKFDQVVAFVKPFEEVTAIPPKLNDADQAALLENLLDFHDGVALAADYPTLLRALGLVVDLEMDCPTGLPKNGMVSVKVSSLPDVFPYSLRTHYTLSDERFLAAPRPAKTGLPETRDGLLRLSDESRYRIVQTDVVGAALKVQNAATSMLALLVPGIQPANPPTEETIPSLRSAGFAVVQSDLAIQLSATYLQAVGLNNALANADNSPQSSILAGPHQPVSAQPVNTDELWAEDVTRGYRLDVRDLESASKKWRSLHQRTGNCQFTRPQPVIIFPVKDEGYVQLGTTEPVDDGSTKVQRIPDVITTWNGWSLSAVRPGKSLVENDEPGEAVQDVPNETKTAFKLVANFKPVSGSLPRLRFGHRYQLRVRTVDLAGNSVFGPDDDPQSEFQKPHPDDTPPQAYRRFEPVPSPAVVLKAKPIEGESVERLVVRSAAQAGDPQHVNRTETERHIVPPKSSQLLSEHHGRFDNANGKPNPDLATYDLAALEANTLTHHWTTGGASALLPQPGVVTLPDGDDKKDPTFWQTKDVFPLEYFYLPDPLARQAVLRNLPGPAQNVVTSIPFNGDWPKCLPFRLKLVGIPAGQAPKAPQWAPIPNQPGTRELVVELAQGESRVVRLNSGTDDTDLPQLGVWNWETEPNTANQAMVSANTAQGLNWLLMPYRELQLVHATQKPLSMPTLQVTNVTKSEGDTAASITGHAHLDGKTTGKVDLLALWVDPEDDLNKEAPGERKSRAAIGEFNVTSPTVTSLPIQANHNLGDTKYHSVTYVARGATRFREYLPVELLVPGKEDLITTPTDAEIAAGNLTTVAVKDVMNSARPQAPVVAYIMPTLGRVESSPPVLEHGWETITRTRSGSGLRVYLERPWFSSGAGELLGVVFREGNFASLSDVLRPYVTEWANDPIWAGPAANLAPSAANFTNIVSGPLTVALDELDEQVRVVGYPVEFDPQKGLWFADIEMAGLNSYTPMVRLALARFQPKSVGNSFISRVVRADFIQPLPDRKLIISRQVSNPLHFTVTLAGLAPNSELQRPVRAWIEKLVSPTQGEFGWERPEGESFTPTILNAGSALWKGEFDLLKMGQYRLVIQETEPVFPTFLQMPGGEDSISDVNVPPTGASLGRTVYMDVWEL